jgi:hypothetical protein
MSGNLHQKVGIWANAGILVENGKIIGELIIGESDNPSEK